MKFKVCKNSNMNHLYKFFQCTKISFVGFLYFEAHQIIFIKKRQFQIRFMSNLFLWDKISNSFDETSHLISIERDEDWELEIFASVLECVQHQNCCCASFSLWVWAAQLGFLARRRDMGNGLDVKYPNTAFYPDHKDCKQRRCRRRHEYILHT